MSEALLTFLFTDIEGSTRLWEAHPAAMSRTMELHDAAIAEAVRAHAGSIFKSVGDACCCVFPQPGDALAAAADAQRNLSAQKWPDDIRHIAVRMGIHSGAAIVGNNDYFGQPLNRVARLTSAAHGGQILVSRSTASLVESSLSADLQLRGLGAHRFKDLNEAEDVFQLVASDLPSEFPAIDALDKRAHNLPAQLTSFVGREAELRTARALLERHRFVTIAGPGGIGKTRLGLQAAADSLHTFKDGCWFVKLAELTNSRFVLDAIAGALEIEPRSSKPLEEELLEYLGTKHMLLVLDNSEHVLSAVAQFCSTALDRCQHLSLIVTSREPTHVAGEQVLRLGPLEAEDSTQLFLERASSDEADLRMSDAEIEDVGAICKRLDGIPLGLELAARRIGLLSARELRRRLETSLDLLRSRDPSESQRHRTLDATMEWSYRLLEQEERTFFASLAAFEGTFDFEACAYVVDAEQLASAALDRLDALIDKSFVIPQRENGLTRYRLLDPVRTFAKSKLSTADVSKLRERHFQWYLSLALRWEPEDITGMSGEMHNMRAALEYGFTQGDKIAASRLLQAVSLFWLRRQLPSEARHWYDIATSQSLSDDLLLSQIYRRASTFATIADDYSAASGLSERALALARQAEDSVAVAEAQHTLAVIEHRRGNTDRAYLLYDEALRGFESGNNDRGVWTTLNNQAMILGEQGRVDEAIDAFSRSAERCRLAGDEDALASVLNNQGEMLLNQGRSKEAEEFFRDALALKRKLGSAIDVASVLVNLGAVAFAAGDLEDAAAHAVEALEEARAAQSPSDAALTLELLAAVAMQRGEAARATDYASRARYIRERVGYSLSSPACISDALGSVSASHMLPSVPFELQTMIDDVLAQYRPVKTPLA